MRADTVKKNPGTPKKGESTRTFQGKKYYYVGRTLYFNKMMQIKDKVRTMGAGVAVTKSKGKGFMIWSTQKVHIPMMEVGGDNLFMEGEYNPKGMWKCGYKKCDTWNKDTKKLDQQCKECGRYKPRRK